MCEKRNGKEGLLRDFEGKLLPHFANEDISKITNILMLSLADYRVEPEPREVAILDDRN